jgi:exopolysaccharide biosynthesis polyprenyl glycosylphosphotransferase
MSVGGIYIAPRSLIAFGAEFLWLIFSAIALVIINSAATKEPLSGMVLLSQTGTVVGTYLAIFFLMDLYGQEVMTPGRALLLNLAQALALLCVVIGILAIGTTILPVDPYFALAHVFLTAIFVICARITIDRLAVAARPMVRIGVIGNDLIRQAHALERERHRNLDLRFYWLGDSIEQAEAKLASKSRDSLGISRLVVDPKLLDDPGSVRFLQQCRQGGLSIEDFRSFAEVAYGKVMLGPHLVSSLTASRVMSSSIGRALRRGRDLGLACFGLVITMPAAILIALAIKLESRGSIFFQQERIGENGRHFKMYKFRSMYLNAKAAAGCEEWTTHEADPRVTRVGHVIRRLHLDELPQLVNVIRGEMSLVGPRPFHPAQVEQLDSMLPHFGLRHLITPGITGWAQITCDYDASVQNREEVFARDLYYVKHAGLLFDLLIMLDTIRVCVWRRGAR